MSIPQSLYHMPLHNLCLRPHLLFHHPPLQHLPQYPYLRVLHYTSYFTSYIFSSEPFMTISATEFCAMVHLFQTLTTTHNALFQQMGVMHAQLDQHTVILHQIQQHLGILPPPQVDIPGPSEPVAPVDDAIRAEAPIQTTQEATRDPSSSHDPATS